MPPADLLLPLTTILLLSIACAILAAKISRRSRNLGTLLGFLALAAMLVHGFWLNDNLLFARILPVANVIAWANIQTPAAGLMAGVAWVLLPGKKPERIAVVLTLTGIAIWRGGDPYWGSRPHTGNPNWHDGICVQTTDSTCSAAAAATLLSQCGIPATESEMVDLCLTKTTGAHTLGIYRGLKLKTAGTPFDVVASNSPPETLRSGPLPALVTVYMPELPGVGHSVLVVAYRDDRDIEIDDPLNGGHQRRTLEELKKTMVPEELALVWVR